MAHSWRTAGRLRGDREEDKGVHVFSEGSHKLDTISVTAYAFNIKEAQGSINALRAASSVNKLAVDETEISISGGRWQMDLRVVYEDLLGCGSISMALLLVILDFSSSTLWYS